MTIVLSIKKVKFAFKPHNSGLAMTECLGYCILNLKFLRIKIFFKFKCDVYHLVVIKFVTFSLSILARLWRHSLTRCEFIKLRYNSLKIKFTAIYVRYWTVPVLWIDWLGVGVATSHWVSWIDIKVLHYVVFQTTLVQINAL